MEIKFTPENQKKLDAIRKHYPTPQAALMPALWLAQEQFGWISEDVMKYVGEVLNIPYETVLGVAEFYTMYNKKPVGKYHLQVCTNVSCMLCGGYDIFDYISERLGIKKNETTPDGKFTLSEAECLGSCGTAPMMQVNNYYEENLTKENIDYLLKKLSKQG
ncbi:MAG TPA: NAD(P)H-dependent oxidoreductase subunit E [Ignavibacteria bacterium]